MKVLIVADHLAATLPLERLLHEEERACQVSVCLNDGYVEPLMWPAPSPVDVVVVDPGASGLDWLATRPAAAGNVIVVSEHLALAARAYELGVGDFVAKPVERRRFADALRKVREHRRSSREAEEVLAVRKPGSVERVPVDELLYAQGADNYTEIVLRDGRRELLDETLTGLATRLRGDFERVHKSFLVRLSAVRRLRQRPGSHHAVELANGDVLPVGRTRYLALRRRLFR